MIDFSIIIPTYNRSELIGKAIKSILRQSLTNFEIIITDNASIDTTEHVVTSFKDKRIKYFKNRKNYGVVRNHNVALEKCKGTFIHIFSDDDLMINRDYLANALQIFENHPNVGLIHSKNITITETDKIIEYTSWAYRITQGFKLENGIMKGSEATNLLMTQMNFISMPTVSIRSNILRQVGFFSENFKYIIDWELWLRLSSVTDFYYSANDIIAYRWHQNTIRKMSEKNLYNELLSMNLRCLENNSEKAPANTRRQIENVQNFRSRNRFELKGLRKMIFDTNFKLTLLRIDNKYPLFCCSK